MLCVEQIQQIGLSSCKVVSQFKQPLKHLVQRHSVRPPPWPSVPPQTPSCCCCRCCGAGLRRRGVPAPAINAFCREQGITRNENTMPMHKLDHHVRLHLDLTAPRALAVLRPLKVGQGVMPACCVPVRLLFAPAALLRAACCMEVQHGDQVESVREVMNACCSQGTLQRLWQLAVGHIHDAGSPWVL